MFEVARAIGNFIKYTLMMFGPFCVFLFIMFLLRGPEFHEEGVEAFINFPLSQFVKILSEFFQL